jgi:hypothetical protein
MGIPPVGAPANGWDTRVGRGQGGRGAAKAALRSPRSRRSRPRPRRDIRWRDRARVVAASARSIEWPRRRSGLEGGMVMLLRAAGLRPCREKVRHAAPDERGRRARHQRALRPLVVDPLEAAATAVCGAHLRSRGANAGHDPDRRMARAEHPSPPWTSALAQSGRRTPMREEDLCRYRREGGRTWRTRLAGWQGGSNPDQKQGAMR